MKVKRYGFDYRGDRIEQESGEYALYNEVTQIISENERLKEKVKFLEEGIELSQGMYKTASEYASSIESHLKGICRIAADWFNEYVHIHKAKKDVVKEERNKNRRDYFLLILGEYERKEKVKCR